MKVLKQGAPLADRKPWWVGLQAGCERCGCRVQLELGDDQGKPEHQSSYENVHKPAVGPAITVHAERHPGGKQWIDGPCPTPQCDGRIQTTLVREQPIFGEPFNPTPAKP